MSERSTALPAYTRPVAALLVTLLVLTTMPSSAPAADVGQFITDAQIAGLSMAVIRNRGIESLTPAGVRNARDGAPIDQQTIFDAASLSKPVFAFAVLQLIDTGALTLDTPLAAMCRTMFGTIGARTQ